jgi:Rrf2 family iron-sulfur cluster assembly transcriptional regulator
VADIILAVDEPIDATQCAGKENCQDDHKCLTHDLWANLNTHIFNYLRSVTLAELVRNHQQAGGVSVIQVTERRPGTTPAVTA